MLMIQMSQWRRYLLTCVLSLAFLGNVIAADDAGKIHDNSIVSTATNVPSYIASALPHARLAGEGKFRWFGLSIYDAQFWVGDKGFQTSAPDAASFALDLRYNRSFYGSKIAESSIDQMRKIGSGSDAEYGPWLSQMKAIFPNVIDGSHITGIFLPNVGTHFYMNGKMIGEISDPHFATAFFGIWLSPKTTSTALRKALLMNATALTHPTQHE